MTGIVIGVLATWAILATIVAWQARRAISDFTLTVAAMNLSLDKLHKPVHALSTLKETLDKERRDRETMAVIEGEASKINWRSA